MRSASVAISSPESASACRAAATIRCAKRSMRRACLRSMYSVGSKPFTSHAKGTAKALEGKARTSPPTPPPPRPPPHHLPGRLHVDAERGHRAEAGDHDPSASVEASSAFHHM